MRLAFKSGCSFTLSLIPGQPDVGWFLQVGGNLPYKEHWLGIICSAAARILAL